MWNLVRSCPQRGRIGSLRDPFQGGSLGLATVIMLMFSLSGRAQQSSATIVETVTDPFTAAIPNAEVTVANQDTGSKRVPVSNSAGAFREAPRRVVNHPFLI